MTLKERCQFFLVRVVIGFVACVLRLLPWRYWWPLVSAVGGLVATMYVKGFRVVSKSYTRVLRHMQLCFPARQEADHHRMVRDYFNHQVLGLLLTVFVWVFRKSKTLPCKLHITGIEHIKYAQSADRGFFSTVPHTVFIELCGMLLNELGLTEGGYVYKCQSKARSEQLFRHYRRSTGIPNTDVKSMLLALKAGKGVWIAPDHDMGQDRPHLFVDFMGVPAATSTGYARLAKKANAFILPATIHYEAGALYLNIEAPFEPMGELDQAKWLNNWVARNVKKYPGQYFWLHQRFKTRPPGMPSLYH